MGGMRASLFSDALQAGGASLKEACIDAFVTTDDLADADDEVPAQMSGMIVT